MPVRTDRIYALIRNSSGLVVPHLPQTDFYSQFLSKGHQRPVRKHIYTPFWFRDGEFQHLRLLKNMYKLGNMFKAFRFVCSAQCVDRVREVCPQLRYVPAVIVKAFYVEYEFDGTIHVPTNDLIRPNLRPEDEDESPDQWLDRLAEKYKSPIPATQWYEIVEADGHQTCQNYPVVCEISATEHGGVSTLTLRPEAVEHFGWVALGESCVSSKVMQAIDEYLPRPYIFALPITHDGRVCIDEAW
jgi:hypothetical protein